MKSTESKQPTEYDLLKGFGRLWRDAIDAEREKADNEWLREGLRGIANMDPKTEGDRMVLWAKDTLSGRATDMPQDNPHSEQK
jgi:hypothetical protein